MFLPTRRQSTQTHRASSSPGGRGAGVRVRPEAMRLSHQHHHHPALPLPPREEASCRAMRKAQVRKGRKERKERKGKTLLAVLRTLRTNRWRSCKVIRVHLEPLSFPCHALLSGEIWPVYAQGHAVTAVSMFGRRHPLESTKLLFVSGGKPGSSCCCFNVLSIKQNQDGSRFSPG
jgi:hypothetical protein